MNLTATLIENDEQTRELLKIYLSELNFVNIQGDYQDALIAYNEIMESRPNIVIVDISEKTELGLDIISKISMNHKSCKIIVTSASYSTDIIIKAMRAGAREFLPKPIIKDDFINAIKKMKDICNGYDFDDNNSKVITVFSNKGGIGKTTIATNLALELANLTREKVALIDLNLQLGDVTTFLDMNPSSDISYVVQNLSRIDDTFLLSTLDKYKETSLYVLADPPYLEQAEEITSEQIANLISVMKKTFSYIIIDTSSNFDGKTITALDNSDLILLMTIVNLPAVRNCQRCLDLFSRLGYENDKTRILVNRYMENDEIKIEDVEEVLKKRIYWKIPNNYFTIMSAINKGVPVDSINADSNVAQSFRELAALLSDNIYKHKIKKIERKPIINFKGFFK